MHGKTVIQVEMPGEWSNEVWNWGFSGHIGAVIKPYGLGGRKSFEYAERVQLGS